MGEQIYSRDFFSQPGNYMGHPQLFQDNFWTEEEHSRFLAALERHRPPYDWALISVFVGTRNPSQVQNHANCYFIVLQRRLPFAAAMGQNAVRITARDMYQDLGMYPQGVLSDYQQQLLTYQQQQLQSSMRSQQAGTSGSTIGSGSSSAAPGRAAGSSRSSPGSNNAVRLKRRLGADESPGRANPLSIDFLLSHQSGSGSADSAKGKQSAAGPLQAKIKDEDKPRARPTPTKPRSCGVLVEVSELEIELEESQRRCRLEKLQEEGDEGNKWEWVRRRILGPRSYQYWFPIFRELIPLSKKEMSEDLRLLKQAPELADLEEKEQQQMQPQRAGKANKRPKIEEEEVDANDKWVQCDRCLKWRRLPASVDMRDIQRQRRWFCEMNPDRKRAKCSIAEPKATTTGGAATRRR